VRTFGTEGDPVAVAAGGGLLWVVNGTRTIVRLDPTTLRVLEEYEARVPIGAVGGVTSLTADGRVLWGTLQAHLVTIDGARGALEVDALPGPDWGPLVVLGGSVWESQVDTLYHLSTKGRVISSLSFPQGAVTAGDGYVWAANQDAGVVAQVDPRTTTVVRTVTVGAGPTGLVFGNGSLWVCSEDGTVTRIDPVAGRPLATIRVGGSPQAIAFGFGRVWVAVS
jgi:YVTN family beta-propeller protein